MLYVPHHTFLCRAQTGGSGPSAEEEAPVVQFARSVRVNVMDSVDGKLLGTICVIDAQPKISNSWSNPNTKLGDYVLVDYKSAKLAGNARRYVAEKKGWKHYLRADWTEITKEDDEDVDDDGEWEILLQDILDEEANFLIYREFLQLITKGPKKPKNGKPPVSKQSTHVAIAGRARDRPSTAKGSPRKSPGFKPRARSKRGGS